MQTFYFFESTLHLEDFSKCWVGSISTLPKFNQFTYIAKTMVHIKESFSIEIPKTVVGNIDYRLINYCHLKVNNLDFYYFVKPLKTEITQNNILFYLEKDEYFSNNLNNGVEYKQTKGIIMVGYRGDAHLNYMNNTQNEMPSDFKRLHRVGGHKQYIKLNGESVGDYAIAHFVFRVLEDSKDDTVYKSRTSSNFFHCAATLSNIGWGVEGFYAIANMTECSPINSEVKWKVECVRAYIVPEIFYNKDFLLDLDTNLNVEFKISDNTTYSLKFITADCSNADANFEISLPHLHRECGRGEYGYLSEDIANGENIYLCTQSRKWKLPPYTACHSENAKCNYNIEMSFNTTDLDIVLSGDFNEWTRENIAQDFEESVFIDSGIIQMLENENLRKTNKIYQGLGIGMSVVGGAVNVISNPMSILGGINGIINSTKGMAMDYAREQDLKNKYNVVGNSGGVSNIAVCANFYGLNKVNDELYGRLRGWYFAYKPLTTYRGNDGYLTYEQLLYGHTMPEHVTQTQSKPSARYMDIVNNLLETAYFLPIFYPKIPLANAKNLYIRYQLGYDCRYFTTRKSSQKFEQALSNGIIFYGKR